MHSSHYDKEKGEFLTKVLVILCSYNPNKTLLEQVDSIILQKNVLIEVQIFDDNSSMGGKYLEHCAEYNNVTVHYCTSSGSAGKNFLRALTTVEFSSANYVALSDQDDVWKKNKLYSAVMEMNENGCSGYSSNLSVWDGFSILGELKKPGPRDICEYYFQGSSAGCTYVLKSDICGNLVNIINKENFLNFSNLVSHDWLIYFLARSLGYQWHHSKESSILYRQHDNNVYGYEVGFLSRIRVKLSWISSGLLKDNFDALSLYSKHLNNPFNYTLSFRNFNFLVKNLFSIRREGAMLSIVMFILVLNYMMSVKSKHRQ